jgi:hypothetical protein
MFNMCPFCHTIHVNPVVHFITDSLYLRTYQISFDGQLGYQVVFHFLKVRGRGGACKLYAFLSPGGIPVFVPSLPRNLQELKERIMAAMSTIITDIIQKVWDELDHRTDVCHVTKGAHIEHM